MSLINNMLRELDERRICQDPLSQTVSTKVHATPKRYHISIVILSLLMSMSVFVVIKYWYMSHHVITHAKINAIENNDVMMNSEMNDIKNNPMVASTHIDKENVDFAVEKAVSTKNIEKETIKANKINIELPPITVQIPDKVAPLLEQPKHVANITDISDKTVQRLSEDKNKVIERQLKDAKQFMLAGFSDSAEKLLYDNLRLDPKNIDSCLQLSALYWETKRVPQALNVLMQTQKIAFSEQVERVLIQYLYALGKFNEAHAHINKLTLSEEDVDFIALKAYLNQQLGHHELALKNYQSLLNKAPDNSLWWVGKGISELGLKQFDAALNSFEHAKQGSLSMDIEHFIDTKIDSLNEKIG